MSYTWTDSTLSTNTNVKTTHVDEMRSNLNTERNRRSLSALSWTDTTLSTNTNIRTVHIQELRNGCDNTPYFVGCSTNYSTVYSNHDSGYLSTKYATYDNNQNTGIDSDYMSDYYNNREGGADGSYNSNVHGPGAV